MSSASAAADAVAAAAVSPVVRNLNSQRLYKIRPGLREAPLLCPLHDPGIPITAAIQIVSDEANFFTPYVWEHRPDAYTVSYVLAGTGKLSVRPRRKTTGTKSGDVQEAAEESVTIGTGDSVLLLPDSHFSLVPALESSSSSSLGHACPLLTDPPGLVPGCSLVTLTITIPARESLSAITAADFEGRKAGKSLERGAGEGERSRYDKDEEDQEEEEAECLGTLSSNASEALLDSPLVDGIQRSNLRKTSAPSSPRESMKMILQQLEDLRAFSPPNSNNTNKLALVFDPVSLQKHFVPFTFAVEELDPGHVIPAHLHKKSVELFVCLKGHGSATLQKGEIVEEHEIWPGSIIAIPPDITHSLRNSDESPMYLLELMFPNDEFAKYIRSGLDQGPMSSEDLCALIQVGCANI